jgi:hypothetical protein
VINLARAHIASTKPLILTFATIFKDLDYFQMLFMDVVLYRNEIHPSRLGTAALFSIFDFSNFQNLLQW